MLKSRGLSKGRRISVFFLISGITLALVLIASSNRQTLVALSMIEYRDIFYLILLCGLMFIFDTLRLRVLGAALGYRLPFFYTVRMIFIGMFFGAITPLQSGMMPLEMYMMYKIGIPLGKAISIDVMKRIMTMGMLAVCGVVVLMLNRGFAANKLILYIYAYVVFFFVLLTALFLVVYLFPAQTLWIVDKILASLHRRAIVKSYDVDAYVKRVANDYFEAVDYYIHKGGIGFVFSLALTLCFLVTQFVMAPIIIESLGFPVSYMNAIQAQIILVPMLYFSPTPGGSGVAEGGFALLFAALIPKHLIGITVVLWRVFSTYIGVTIGGILTIGSINLDKVLGFGKKRNGAIPE